MSLTKLYGRSCSWNCLWHKGQKRRSKILDSSPEHKTWPLKIWKTHLYWWVQTNTSTSFKREKNDYRLRKIQEVSFFNPPRHHDCAASREDNGPKTMSVHKYTSLSLTTETVSFFLFHSQTFSLILKWHINIWNTSTHHLLSNPFLLSSSQHTLPLSKSLIVCKSHHHHHSLCLSTDVDRLHIL